MIRRATDHSSNRHWQQTNAYSDSLFSTVKNGSENTLSCCWSWGRSWKWQLAHNCLKFFYVFTVFLNIWHQWILQHLLNALWSYISALWKKSCNFPAVLTHPPSLKQPSVTVHILNTIEILFCLKVGDNSPWGGIGGRPRPRPRGEYGMRCCSMTGEFAAKRGMGPRIGLWQIQAGKTQTVNSL